MNSRQFASRPLSVLGSDRMPIRIIVVAAVLGVLTRMVYGFGRDIFSDDAYYYTLLARSLVESGRISFDGISVTNGFHPLLFWIEVGIVRLLGPSVSPFELYSALIVFFAFVLLAFAGLYALVCRSLARKTSQVQVCLIMIPSMGICFLSRYMDMFYSGMETALAFPLGAFTVILIYLRKYVLAGLIGALLVAVRLDSFTYFLIPLSVLYGVHEWLERQRLLAATRMVIKLALPAVVFVVFYMLFNYVNYGAWMPISGALKSTFPTINLQLHNIQGRFPTISLLTALIGGCLLMYPGRVRGWLRLMGFAFVLVTLSQLSSFVFFQKWAKPVPVWYLGLPLFTGLSGMAFGIANYLSPNRLRFAALSFSLLIALANLADLVRTAYNAVSDSQFEISFRTETINFVKSKPREEIWAYTDCGGFAFWSGRRFVNLDGVVNDLEYQNRLLRQELGDYLEENSVRYLVTGIWDQVQTVDREYEPMYKYRVAPEVYSGEYDRLSFFVYSYLHDTYSDELQLPKDAEIWRSSGHVDGKARACFVVYDLEMAREYWETQDLGK